MPPLLTVAGNDATCDALCDVSITRGRQHPAENYDPSTFGVTLINTTAGSVRRGDTVTFALDAPASTPTWDNSTDTWDAQTGTWDSKVTRITLFSGYVTDLTAAWLITPEGTLPTTRCVAVDPLTALANTLVGDAPWPSETCAARASRIAALVGIALTILGTGPVLLARDVDRQPALDLLDGCAADGSEWGGIFYDPSSATYQWTLGTERNTTTAAITVDACNMLGDFTVVQAVSDIVNDVTVTYGSPTAEVYATDAGSASKDGTRHVTISTHLANTTDAQQRATDHLTRYLTPAWKVDHLLVPSSLLDPAGERPFAESLLKLPLGARIAMTGLPAPASSNPNGYLEGWSFDMQGSPDKWSVGLHVSPAQWSGPLITWDGADTAVAPSWDAVPYYTAWNDVVGG